jgi:hypothetical protein
MMLFEIAAVDSEAVPSLRSHGYIPVKRDRGHPSYCATQVFHGDGTSTIHAHPDVDLATIAEWLDMQQIVHP